ncbi:hypothetical protein FALBO_8698 [Fusarium albosuccineum]|uniref:Azaphilone pigments biosynthesis cluster protein L N-terminal domain-containing protein n=1 Tax=Fusarium albosuccineum TaxID=1237068 RepID=A0A8H4L7G6_9HYPO|nr:hypothetical protein FALBO_8698 [Fusarium albosuccineum]
MESCLKSNNELRDKLEKIFPSSKDGKTTMIQGLKLQYHEKDILVFKSRLTSHKSTISVALGLATFILSNENQEAVQDLTEVVMAATSRINGQIEGLEMAMLSVQDFGKHDNEAARVLQRHADVLQQCLAVCTAAMDMVRGKSDHIIRKVELFDDSLHMAVSAMGDISVTGQPLTVDGMRLHQRAKQMTVGTVGTSNPDGVIRGLFYGQG